MRVLPSEGITPSESVSQAKDQKRTPPSSDAGGSHGDGTTTEGSVEVILSTQAAQLAAFRQALRELPAIRSDRVADAKEQDGRRVASTDIADAILRFGREA